MIFFLKRLSQKSYNHIVNKLGTISFSHPSKIPCHQGITYEKLVKQLEFGGFFLLKKEEEVLNNECRVLTYANNFRLWRTIDMISTTEQILGKTLNQPCLEIAQLFNWASEKTNNWQNIMRIPSTSTKHPSTHFSWSRGIVHLLLKLESSKPNK